MRQNPREGPTRTRARGPTHHPARAAPAERPLCAGTALPEHPGRTGQVPSSGAIPASACKGRREADAGAGRSFKGNAATRAQGRNQGARGGRTALDSELRSTSLVLLNDLGQAEEPLGLSLTISKMKEGGLDGVLHQGCPWGGLSNLLKGLGLQASVFSFVTWQPSQCPGHQKVLTLQGGGSPQQSCTLQRKHAATGPDMPLPLTSCRTLEDRLGLSEPQFPPLGNGVLGVSLVKIQWLDIQYVLINVGRDGEQGSLIKLLTHSGPESPPEPGPSSKFKN